MGKINTIFKDKKHNLIGLYLCCALIGLLTGLTVIAFRILLIYVGNLKTERYKVFLDNYSLEVFSLWGLYFFVISVFLYFAMKLYPNIKSGGIPVTRAGLLKQRDFSWPQELLLKFIGTILTVGNGMSLGRKGPSIQMGAIIGDGIHKIFKRSEYEKTYLVSCGAAAGLASTFNAPLAGVIFTIEKLNKFLSPTLVICVMIAAVTGDLVTRETFGLEPTFIFNLDVSFDLRHYPTIIILAVISAVLGIVFTRASMSFKKGYSAIGIHPVIKIFFIFLMAFAIGIMYTKYLGVGYSLADSLFKSNFPYMLLLLFLIVKFLFTLICSSSGVPGGIFLPMLLIGSLIGKIYGEVLFDLFSFERGYIIYFVVLGMTSFFTAVVRTPITACVLMLELTGSFEHFFPIIISSMIAFLITEIAGTTSIYELLLTDLLNLDKPKKRRESKITFSFPVISNSHLEGKFIRDIQWPEGSLVVCIEREGEEFIPRGDTRVDSGDLLTVLIGQESLAAAKMKLIEMGEEKIAR